MAAGNRGLGDVFKAQGKFDEALKAYRDALALSKPDAPDDQSPRRDLYNKIGEVLQAQEKTSEKRSPQPNSNGL